MSEPFLGAIVAVPFDFAPRGWALCDGQTLPINQNTAIFALLGTTYGGDGQTTFQLPNLQSRVAIHQGEGAGLGLYELGQTGGEEAHTLTSAESAAHAHTVTAQASKDEETTNRPDGAYFTIGGVYANTADPGQPMGATLSSAVGGSEPHENRQPVLALQFVIALQGIFPTRS